MRVHQILFYAPRSNPLFQYQKILESMDCEAVPIAHKNELENHFATHQIEAAIIDITQSEGQDFFKKLRQMRFDLPLLLITQANINFRDPMVLQIPENQLEQDFLLGYSRLLNLIASHHLLNRRLERLQGNSETITKIRKQLKQSALSDAAVLITGESGTGKELAARVVASLRPPFIVVNCSAIPENLFESELFGHVKGAFTGASSSRKGLFAEADGGTLFLDEIGDMPLAVQTKLLRAIQEGEIRPVGSNINEEVNVRIVAATNRDLEQEVRQQNFRQDLYFRLNVLPVHIPPIRQRPQDKKILLDHFIKSFSPFPGHPNEVTPSARKTLEEYSFPGNVREMENLIQRAITLAGMAPLEIKHFLLNEIPAQANSANAPQNYTEFKEAQKSAEKEFLEQKLSLYHGKVADCARILGVGRTALHNRFRSLGINPEDFRSLGE